MNIFINPDNVKNTLDSIGQTYDDDEVLTERFRREGTAASGGGVASTTGDEFSIDTTISTAEYIRRAGIHQRRKKGSGGGAGAGAPETAGGAAAAFSGVPADVVQFRSCMAPGRGRRGDGDEEASAAPPAQSGPFNAQVLATILLFIDASNAATIVQFGRTCHMWYYYANYAPHWTHLRRTEWKRRHTDLPKYIRLIVMKPKLVTREEYIEERKRVSECERRERIIGRAKFVRWCVAVGILAAASITCNYVVAYILGYLRTALRSDVNLGITAFLLSLVMTVLEVTLVINPLSGGSQSTKETTIRVLCWSLLILTLSLVFSIVTALAYTRVQALSHVLDRPEVDFAMGAACSTYPSKYPPSFIFLPALLTDPRWRPITFDPTGAVFKPYCIGAQCYVLLYFDAWYRSAVFDNATALHKWKNVGTATAFGFYPFEEGRPISGMWCAASEYPQVIGVTSLLYTSIVEERDALYPTDAYWLSPSVRPSDFRNYSFRGSSDINRESTEDPKGSTAEWVEVGVPWKRHFIPLTTNHLQKRADFSDKHYMFLNYAFACYIISGVVWGVMFVCQLVFKNSAIYLLGITTCITLLFLNPISMIISGFLCVNIRDEYFMCNRTSGGALIGGGFALTFLCIVIYLSAIE